MALSWSAKRQLGYFSIFAVAGLILIYIYIISPVLNVTPTCFDSKQNGSEQGIDCGGGCAKLCNFQANTILIRWARVFPVTSSIYNAVAYVENQNSGSAVRSIAYEFKVYDEQGTFITARSGTSFIGPAGRFVIFEPSINVGNRVPAKTLFKFTAVPVWEKIDKRWESFPVTVRDRRISNAETSPKVEATIANDSIYDLSNIPVINILYNAEGNAISASRTYLDSLPKNSTAQVFFTWPAPFKEAVVNIEILPELNPFSINL